MFIKSITIFALGAMFSLGSSLSLGGLLGGNSASTTTNATVGSSGGTTNASVSNQTSASILGDTVQSSTDLSTILGL